MEAHPTAMPPDTESDEQHKAAKANPESPGEHIHIQIEKEREGRVNTNACAKASRRMHNHPDMYSAHMNMQAGR